MIYDYINQPHFVVPAAGYHLILLDDEERRVVDQIPVLSFVVFMREGWRIIEGKKRTRTLFHVLPVTADEVYTSESAQPWVLMRPTGEIEHPFDVFSSVDDFKSYLAKRGDGSDQ